MLPDDFSELLSAYLDGELPARQRKDVRRLLDESDEARRMLRRMEGDALLLRELPPARLPFDLTNAILASIATELPPQRLPIPTFARPAGNRRTFGKVYAAAAAVLLAVGIGSWPFLGGAGEGTPEVAVSSNGPRNGAGQGGAPETEPVIGPEVPHRPGSHSVFAYPNRQATELSTAPNRLPLIQQIGEVDPAQLLGHLKRRVPDSVCRVDLFCTQPGKTLDILGLACGNQGVRIIVDPAAMKRLESDPGAALALYLENVTPAEVARILSELGGTASPFSAFVVDAGPVGADDLARVLGGPAKDFAPPSQRPIDQNTVGELVRSLPGLAENDEKVPYHVAVVVPHVPTAAERCSEVQSLLDGYRESRPGSMALLLVLRAK